MTAAQTHGRPFRLSIAIPLHNEERVLPELLRRTLSVLDGLPGGPHELLFVDDGSTDATLQIATAAAARDGRIVVLELSRNFGHQMALTAALDHVTGDAVVLMDGDLQDTPEAIPLFVEHHLRGFDVVYAKRVHRKESVFLRAAYWTFYRLAASISDIRLPLDAGDFSLLSRRVVDAIRSSPERNRFLRGLRSWVGFRQLGIDVERAARAAGTSKYSLRRLLHLAADGLFAFSVVPLRAAMAVGLLTILAAGLFTVYAVMVRLLSGTVPAGFTALLVVVTFLSGIILFFLGVIGEYVGRIYEEVKRRPPYLLASVMRAQKAGRAGLPPAPYGERAQDEP
jgi:polyisoprenyl-phosphate glycosyltransferase